MTTTAPRSALAATAAVLTDHLREHFDPAMLPVQQVLALAEEAGEFTAAYRRWAGLARRTGPWQDVEAELADVVITAYVTANVLGIDLDAAWQAKANIVFTRGWRQPPTVSEWACEDCGAAYFGTPPMERRCPGGCVPATEAAPRPGAQPEGRWAA